MHRRSVITAAGLAAAAPFLPRPTLAQAARIVGGGAVSPRQAYEKWAQLVQGPLGVQMSYQGSNSNTGADQVVARRDLLTNVHIEDMRAGIHEHLMFGEGEIDFQPVIAALAKIGYAGVVGVELSRHSHAGPEAARQAYNFLQPLIRAAGE